MGQMGFLELDLSSWAEFGIAVTTLILAVVTALTVRQMNLQQKKDRSHKEMTLLVGQLRSRQKSNFLFGITGQTQGGIPDRDRCNASTSKTCLADDTWNIYYNFWDNIKINMYLGDPDLLSALENYIIAKDNYWMVWARDFPNCRYEDNPVLRQKYERIKTTREALRIETERRYKNLRREINELEQRSWWQLW
jgi:hypothetical protein